MKNIEIEDDIYEKLGEIAIPFVETDVSMVIRRLLGNFTSKPINTRKDNKTPQKIFTSYIANDLQSSSDEIEQLRQASLHIKQPFLTFLMDKNKQTHGNYRTSDIVPFMETYNLHLPSGLLRNPWMKAPYTGQNNGVTSCKRTLEHYRQTRKYGCWNGKDIKTNCDASDYCIYHPDNPDEMKNKCDLRKGVIWKRKNPSSPFTYGTHYLNVIERELLDGKLVPLQPLLAVFYSGRSFDKELIEEFKSDFHMNDQEMELFQDR